MSDFEKWFKTTSAYRMLESMNYYKMDLFHWIEARGEYRHTSVQIAFMTWVEQQAKIDELQRRNQMLNDNIKEQGQKLVYQNEVIETQSEKLLGLRDEKAELQKRVDDLTQVVEELLEEMKYPTATFEEVICSGVRELEQALKGGSDE